MTTVAYHFAEADGRTHYYRYTEKLGWHQVCEPAAGQPCGGCIVRAPTLPLCEVCSLVDAKRWVITPEHVKEMEP